MRKLVVLVLCGVLVAPLAFGEVLSRNAVGYVKRTIEPGDFDYIQMPFVDIDGNDWTLSTLLPDVPNNTQALLWDEANQEYIPALKNFLGVWNPDPVIVPGQGLFVKIPDTEPAAVEVFLLGEVPGTNSYPQVDTPIVAGFTAVGVPYPEARTVETSGLAGLPNFSQVLLWDIANQGYIVVEKNFLGNWLPAALPINPGDGFFVQTGAATTYTETPTYDWPEN